MPKTTTLAQARYDTAHTTQVKLKLNNDTDSDILARLAQAKASGSIQGYIKNLIRQDIAQK